jgi:hypothetical protein
MADQMRTTGGCPVLAKWRRRSQCLTVISMAHCSVALVAGPALCETEVGGAARVPSDAP